MVQYRRFSRKALGGAAYYTRLSRHHQDHRYDVSSKAALSPSRFPSPPLIQTYNISQLVAAELTFCLVWTSPGFVVSHFLPVEAISKSWGLTCPIWLWTLGYAVEDLDAVEEVGPGLFPCSVDSTPDTLLFQSAENNSATVLSMQLPRRLMLGTRPYSLQNFIQPSLPY